MVQKILVFTIKKKIQTPTARTTTSWPHTRENKNKWKCLRAEKWFVFRSRTHSQVNKQTNPLRHGECYEIKWGVVHNVLVFTIKIKNGRPTPRTTTSRPHILSLDAYPMKSNKLLLQEVGISIKLYGERGESFWFA